MNDELLLLLLFYRIFFCHVAASASTTSRSRESCVGPIRPRAASSTLSQYFDVRGTVGAFDVMLLLRGIRARFEASGFKELINGESGLSDSDEQHLPLFLGIPTRFAYNSSPVFPGKDPLESCNSFPHRI
ncbi:hypothetical protein T310_2914 [Rasamsonia emersonii CBS 393.64]|uniref:Uncharacterized protein n=1 Tax=Rasamsonia emersonii (strain ATCC 16479 / CBS 393.64 / IMI 116815) TaxID=1408163 RepID=A0A0F4YY50_RASE3|nr:hypothetical protein T310_2914 [Rasamsonia emersonii CBS 393.64]KKA23035.1 hypothetical protein T310_2914 [Rasamsonia emersonii CBS 393.64]